MGLGLSDFTFLQFPLEIPQFTVRVATVNVNIVHTDEHRIGQPLPTKFECQPRPTPGPAPPSYSCLVTPVRRGMNISPLNRISSIQRHFTMNAQELKNFLADSPPSAVNLEIKKHFEALDDKQKRYAHFISRYVY